VAPWFSKGPFHADLAVTHRTVDQELLVRTEYLATENRILRNQIKGRLRLSNGERKALADIGQKLGKKALEEVAILPRVSASHR
jgi:putative transposase